MLRAIAAGLTVAGLAVAAWLGASATPAAPEGSWTLVTEGVFRSRGFPTAYALISGDSALLIGASDGADTMQLKKLGAKSIHSVLLTHHHRDTAAKAAEWVAAEIPVRAPKASAAWLSSDGVAKYWKTSLPTFDPEHPPGLRDRSFGLWDYLVVPQGVDGIRCDLSEPESITFGLWTIDVIAAPGHSRDHTAYLARRRPESGKSEPGLLFCGDALARPGMLWAPYSTDWHHCFNEGLDATVATLKKLAELEAGTLCPEHGPPIVGADKVRQALLQTAQGAEKTGRLKSYEWYTKESIGNPPDYAYLAPEQVATAGEKPWSRLSEHLFLTGNTYALVSKDGPVLIIDPFGEKIAEQVRILRDKHQLGAVEVLLISHAHNDHYTGAFLLPGRDVWRVWTLDEVAKPLLDPLRYCAPYLDPRAVRVDRILKDGETATWREYEFRFHHLPGQTQFTMGFEVTVDGKRCFHVADNFFHADQFTGSGGWSGRNRSWPDDYAASAEKVRNAGPEWILAEHGGPYSFHAEDYRRRIAWGKEATRAADALCVSGRHRLDWHPQAIRIEPLKIELTPGGEATVQVLSESTFSNEDRLRIRVEGRGLVSAEPLDVPLKTGDTFKQSIRLRAAANLSPGRHVIAVTVTHHPDSGREPWQDSSDVFLIVEVPPGEGATKQ